MSCCKNKVNNELTKRDKSKPKFNVGDRVGVFTKYGNFYGYVTRVTKVKSKVKKFIFWGRELEQFIYYIKFDDVHNVESAIDNSMWIPEPRLFQ